LQTQSAEQKRLDASLLAQRAAIEDYFATSIFDEAFRE
jgi:hypothetical protein